MRIIYFGLIILSLAACEKNAPKIEKKDFTLDISYSNTSSLPTHQTNKALTEFIEACPSFALAANELTDVVFSGPEPTEGPERLRGWTEKYRFQFKVPSSPKSQVLIAAAAMGHTCFYAFGGGTSPGLTTYKTPCARICNMPETGFLSVDNMEHLDLPSSVAYKKRMENLDGEYQSYIAKYKKNSEQGDYDAQRNLAYTYAMDSFTRHDRILGCAWRIAILENKNKSTAGDESNARVDCARMNEEEKGEVRNALLSIQTTLNLSKKTSK